LNLDFKQILRYGMLIPTSMVINLGVTYSLERYVGLTESISYALALISLLVFNFISFRYFVFKDKKQRMVRQWSTFLSYNLGLRVLEYLLWHPVRYLLSVYEWHYLFANVVVSVIFTILKYFVYSQKVFTDKDG
jgi:putative flippase GtrA